ncbi:MAG: ABC transporter substrate-binding protein [Deltaproteobacteria bacterium]|nr:ABC transporter substrate-binding protein [Deltaproteobacteria bacterium]MBW2118516.1 ABC transporter substrate-binding protein [Deltaproteobacteria bacterium]MBW2343997.1 ABC transporter substrate-binding protein [Deltaproteobacteria bacterium]
MKARHLTVLVVLLVAVLFVFPGNRAMAEKPIVIGCPLSTAFLYGWDAERGVKLAVEEINAQGGVNVGGEKRPFKVEVIDTRDLEPGVPVSEALLAVEKLILDKKADFILGGPVRSEAALAAMSLLSKYKKVSIVTTGVLTPKYHALVAKQYDKYKYCFRIHGEARQLVGEMFANFTELKEKYGFNNLFIIAQDVSHARGAAKVMKKVALKKGWNVTGVEIYPTGASDFSMGLLKVKRTKTEIINIWMDMPESSILLKQWYDMKIPALPFGSTLAAAEQPGFWKATEGKGEYTLCNVVNAGNAPSEATPWTMKFYNAYAKKWKVEPEGLGSSSSYMAVYVLRDAIERAGTLNSDKVVSELEKTDVMGVYGRLRFDPKSHQVIPSSDPKEGAVGTILQWQAGKRIVVFPKSIATGTIKLPPWMKK